METTYGELEATLESELDLMGQGPWRMTFQQWLEVLSREGAVEADAAVQSFAATRSWPLLQEHTRLEVCARLAAARFYFSVSAGALILEAYPSVKDALQSVMIEWWRDVGREQWFAHQFFQENSGW